MTGKSELCGTGLGWIGLRGRETGKWEVRFKFVEIRDLVPGSYHTWLSYITCRGYLCPF